LRGFLFWWRGICCFFSFQIRLTTKDTKFTKIFLFTSLGFVRRIWAFVGLGFFFIFLGIFLMEPQDQAKTIEQQIDFLHEAFDADDKVKTCAFLADTHSAEIAHVMESTPTALRLFIWDCLKIPKMAEVLKHLRDDVRNEFASRVDAETLARIALYLSTDDLADILGGLPDHAYLEVLSTMGEQDRERVKAALSYPEDVAGGLMNTDTVSVRPDVSLDVVLRYLRIREEVPTATDALFVVNDSNQLLGKLNLQSLVTSQPSLSVADVMETDIQSIDAHESANEVANLFDKYDLISAPVVDEQGRLVGRITVDDVVDLIREEADQTLMNFAGLTEENTFTPIKVSAKRRVLWLTINLGTAILAVFVTNQFESTLDQLAVIAILMTIVPSMGGGSLGFRL